MKVTDGRRHARANMMLITVVISAGAGCVKRSVGGKPKLDALIRIETFVQWDDKQSRIELYPRNG
jgi:hypothetical protein